MASKSKQPILYSISFLIILISASVGFTCSPVQAQIPTVAVPTVTGTPSGPLVTVKAGQNEPFINVRSGPNALYPKVGLLLEGQSAPALGKSPLGEWIMIAYSGAPGGVGWVYSIYVDLTPGAVLPIIEPPPTVTPLMTQTVNPTLAAQFIVTVAPTRLPTFTEPAPLVIPTFAPSEIGGRTGVPTGLIIVILFTIGILAGIFSLIQRK